VRLTLERDELILLIGKSLGYDIADEDVTVKADPFEVRIKNVDLAGMSQPPRASEDSLEYSEEDTEDEEAEKTEEEDIAGSILTMGDILNQNTAMGGAGAATAKVVGDIPRRELGPMETHEPPPYNEEELKASQRTGR